MIETESSIRLITTFVIGAPEIYPNPAGNYAYGNKECKNELPRRNFIPITETAKSSVN